jgi:hypothetical protein
MGRDQVATLALLTLAFGPRVPVVLSFTRARAFPQAYASTPKGGLASRFRTCSEARGACLHRGVIKMATGRKWTEWGGIVDNSFVRELTPEAHREDALSQFDVREAGCPPVPKYLVLL